MSLSPHFTLSEFTRSATAESRGINNTVPPSLIPSLRNLCLTILEPLRAHAGQPIRITSGYRCPELNAAVGGSRTSQHMRGEAVDIHCPTTAQLHEWFQWIKTHCPFDQLILERSASATWIHVSLKPSLTANRHQVLTLNR